MTVAVMKRAIALACPYIKIIETPGWENRSNGLALNPAGGFPMDHHLVVRLQDTPDYVAFCVSMATNGHAALSGPLCNTLSTPSGVLYVIAGGAANHSGRGSSAVLARLRAGQGPGSPGPDDMTGNAWFIGDEAMHPGDNTPWPAALRRTKAIWAAAVLVAGGKKKALSLQHKEWSLRKIDCSFGSGDSQRDAVMFWIGVFLGITAPERPSDAGDNPTPTPIPTHRKRVPDMYLVRCKTRSGKTLHGTVQNGRVQAIDETAMLGGLVAYFPLIEVSAAWWDQNRDLGLNTIKAD